MPIFVGTVQLLEMHVVSGTLCFIVISLHVPAGALILVVSVSPSCTSSTCT